jgi:integrase
LRPLVLLAKQMPRSSLLRRHGKPSALLPALPQMSGRWSNAALSLRGILTKVCPHSFRATGITTYLQNGGKLEVAQHMAGHESSRTTGLYDRRSDDVALDEIERIVF